MHKPQSSSYKKPGTSDLLGLIPGVVMLATAVIVFINFKKLTQTQTGLSFELQRRPTQVWVVQEKP